MKRTAIISLALAMLTGFAGIAAAHPRAPRIDRRELRQEIRIRQGIRDGRLTWREARRLRAGDRRIRAYERRARADGRLTLRERARLHRALDRQSGRIWRLKHNRMYL